MECSIIVDQSSDVTAVVSPGSEDSFVQGLFCWLTACCDNFRKVPLQHFLLSVTLISAFIIIIRIRIILIIITQCDRLIISNSLSNYLLLHVMFVGPTVVETTAAVPTTIPGKLIVITYLSVYHLQMYTLIRTSSMIGFLHVCIIWRQHRPTYVTNFVDSVFLS